MHQLLDHPLLAYVLIVVVVVAVGVVDGEVSVYPYFDAPCGVHADLALLNHEVLRMLEDFSIALQSLHQHIEILRKGDVVDLAEPDNDMLDVDPGHVGLRAKLAVVALDDEAGVHDVGLVVPPVEGFQVV